MSGAHVFLHALVIVLAVAAITTVLFQRLRQPVVLGYLLAGLIVGPHVPVPLVADLDVVRTLSELGVILLMFALGLEFSLRKLVQVCPTSGITALVQSSIMVWLGFLVGRAFGWTPMESVFAGAIVAISSTTIIAKAFDELKVRGRLRDLVVGVLLVEDLFAILFMAVLTAVATGAGLSPLALGLTLGKLGAFLAAILVAGMLAIPRAIRYVHRLDRPETLLVASLALCFGISYLALAAGYSVALGAFIAGSLVAESGEAHAVEELVRPVRDLFAAIFFVSVGMLIDPALVREHWVAIVVFIPLVVIGKSAAVSMGAFLTGNGVRTSVQAGMSLAQIGEFSFILASLGSSLGATRDFLYPLAVAVSAVTTLTTPWLIGASGGVASWVDRKLPHTAQMLFGLYASWIRAAPHLAAPRHRRGAGPPPRARAARGRGAPHGDRDRDVLRGEAAHPRARRAARDAPLARARRRGRRDRARRVPLRLRARRERAAPRAHARLGGAARDRRREARPRGGAAARAHRVLPARRDALHAPAGDRHHAAVHPERRPGGAAPPRSAPRAGARVLAERRQPPGARPRRSPGDRRGAREAGGGERRRTSRGRALLRARDVPGPRRAGGGAARRRAAPPRGIRCRSSASAVGPAPPCSRSRARRGR